MAISTGDVLEVTFVTQQADQAGLNVAHFRVGATVIVNPDTSNEFDLGQSLNTTFGVLYQNLMTSAATYRGVIVKRLLPTLGPTVPSPATIPLIGARGANPLPKQVAGIFTKVSSAAGRHGRGRMYIPHPAEDDNDTDTTPSVAYMTALAFLSQRHVGTFTYTSSLGGETADLIGVILDRTAMTTSDTIVVINREKWATQRRRGSYGKINAPPF